MKLSKTGWLILTIGILIIILSSLGVTFSQQIKQRNRLREELSLAQQRLDSIQFDQLYSQQEELTGQLSQTEADLDITRASLSQPVNSIDASDTLFDIAGTCSVEVTEIKSSPPTTIDLAGLDCFVLPLTTQITGDLSQLISFIVRLNSDLVNSVVGSVDITVYQPATDTKSSASIRQLIHYCQDD